MKKQTAKLVNTIIAGVIVLGVLGWTVWFGFLVGFIFPLAAICICGAVLGVKYLDHMEEHGE